MRKPATHYAENMRRLKARGWTFERIGKRYGVSKQRVAQIIGEPRAFWCDASSPLGDCLRRRGHSGAHTYGKREAQIIGNGKP